MRVSREPQLPTYKWNMREIKFRVWDETAKKMYNIEVLLMPSRAKDGCANLPFDMSWDDIWLGYGDICATPQDNHRPLMQYTGLKDKSGKEIYFDDIIRYDNTNFMVIMWEGGITGKGKNEDYLDIYTIQKECEIIGNIYENKNLLNNNEQ